MYTTIGNSPGEGPEPVKRGNPDFFHSPSYKQATQPRATQTENAVAVLTMCKVGRETRKEKALKKDIAAASGQKTAERASDEKMSES